jgi:hypothetical protein
LSLDGPSASLQNRFARIEPLAGWCALLAAPAIYNAAFHPIQTVEQLPETVGYVGFCPKRRQGAQEARRRLAAELMPDIGSKPFASVAIVAGHHSKSCVGFETPPAREWFRHCCILASKAGEYSKI